MSKVYHHVRRFSLNEKKDRVHFAKEIHNLIENEKEKKVNADDAVDKYKKVTQTVSYPTYTTTKKRPQPDGGNNNADEHVAKHPRADGDQQEDQGGSSSYTVTVTESDVCFLRSKGYNLIADDDKGELEPLVKVRVVSPFMCKKCKRDLRWNLRLRLMSLKYTS